MEVIYRRGSPPEVEDFGKRLFSVLGLLTQQKLSAAVVSGDGHTSSW
jgi:hypothetical protein